MVDENDGIVLSLVVMVTRDVWPPSTEGPLITPRWLGMRLAHIWEGLGVAVRVAVQLAVAVMEPLHEVLTLTDAVSEADTPGDRLAVPVPAKQTRNREQQKTTEYRWKTIYEIRGLMSAAGLVHF